MSLLNAFSVCYLGFNDNIFIIDPIANLGRECPQDVRRQINPKSVSHLLVPSLAALLLLAYGIQTSTLDMVRNIMYLFLVFFFLVHYQCK